MNFNRWTHAVIKFVLINNIKSNYTALKKWKKYKVMHSGRR